MWVCLDEKMMAHEQVLVDGADILMLGRITFNDFAAHWPSLANEPVPQAAESPSLDDMRCTYARRIDVMKKIVVSSSGNVAAWRNSETLTAITGKNIDCLKKESGCDIVIYGSLSVINALSALDLVDEYHLLLHPLVLGKGQAPVR
jgi:dihydrofolate reductase